MTGTGAAAVALLSARFKHISFELSAEIGFLAAGSRNSTRNQRMSFEMTKIFGWVLAAMMLAMVSGIIAGILVHPKPLAQPAYMVANATPAPAQEAAPAGAAKPQATATAQSKAPAAAAPPPAAAAAAPPAAGGQQAKAEEGGAEPIGPLLASANAGEGKNRARVCNACHTFDKGGPNRIGPNLYGIVDEPIAENHNGFSFSPALSAHKGEKWTVDELNQWLTKPQAFARGTKMTFAGLPNAKDRADVIAYLNSLSDSPKPLTASK
jgi:cytochrome c